MTNRSQDDEAANAITQVRQAIKQVVWPIKPAAVISLETQTCFVKNRRKSQVCVSNNRHILILLNALFARQKMRCAIIIINPRRACASRVTVVVS